MGRATVSDVFDAVARFNNQILHHETQELKEKNELNAKTNYAQIQTNIQNYIRDNPYEGGNNEFGDELACRNYFDKLKNFIGEKYAYAEQKNTSNHYRKIIDEMKTQSLEVARNYSLEEQDKWRKNRELVNCNENLKNLLDSYMTPEDMIEAMHNQIEFSADTIGWNPQQRYEMTQTMNTAAYQKFMTNRLSMVNDVNKLDGAVKEIHDAFGFMPKSEINIYDKEGKITGIEERDWSFDKRDEWEKALVENETKRIYGEHWAVFQDKQSQMIRYLISGDINNAMSLCREWGAKFNEYYNPRNLNFNNLDQSYRNRGENFFDIRMIEGYMRQNLGGREKDLLTAEIIPAMFINPQFRGDGTVVLGNFSMNGDGTIVPGDFIRTYENGLESFEGFMYYRRKATEFKYQDHIDPGTGELNAFAQIAVEKEMVEWSNKYWDYIRSELRRKDPTMLSDFDKFRKAETYSDPRSEYYDIGYARLSRDEQDRYTSMCIKYFNDLFLTMPAGQIDFPALRQKMREFTNFRTSLILNNSTISTTDQGERYRALKRYSNTAMSEEAEKIIFTQSDPERLGLGLEEPNRKNLPYVDKNQSVFYRTTAQEGALNEIRQEEKRISAGILGLRMNQLKEYWMPSERQYDDVIGKGIFVIEEGNHAGTYYLEYDQNANPYLMKRNNSEGKWEKYEQGQGQREPTRDEMIIIKRNIENEITQEAFKNINAYTGEQLNLRIAPPDFEGGQAGYDRHREKITQNDKDLQTIWLEYLNRLNNTEDGNNSRLLYDSISRGINPLNGERLNIHVKPPGYTDVWRGDGDKQNAWIQYFSKIILDKREIEANRVINK